MKKKKWRTYKLKLTDEQTDFLEMLKSERGINKSFIMSKAVGEFIDAYMENIDLKPSEK